MNRLIYDLRFSVLTAWLALLHGLVLGIAIGHEGNDFDTTSETARDFGRFEKWSRIEFVFAGPAAVGLDEPNPFAISLDVVFTGPNEKSYRVPGFYDGDGHGGLNGNVWKVRFSADQSGPWRFKTRSGNSELNGQAGQFTVTEVNDGARGFWKWGRLEYKGTPENGIRYLKLRDGPYWLKAGCDDPENFLGSYGNFDTLSKRKAAIDYLAQRGVNSFYIMTHNLGGDDNDVWPWLGDTAPVAKLHGGSDARFDVRKLEQWRELFEHMQSQGVVPYLVLEDDSAWKEYNHARYYREMIARFGYLPALLFNLGEEHNENYSLSRALALMALLDEIDPYDHPRGIHNVNRVTDEYVDAPQLHFTAIQTGSPTTRRSREEGLKHNQMAIDWIERCRARGRRVLMVGFDEGRPEEERSAWWSAYLGGGVWEAHILPPYDRPHSSWEPVWTELGGTRAFMESLPFWQMQPHNDLIKSGQAFCLADPGNAYALYLPAGGTVTIRLRPDASYEYAWWNPINGRNGDFQDIGKVAGGDREFTTPSLSEWALRVIRLGNQ
jgi:hypothetical protein